MVFRTLLKPWGRVLAAVLATVFLNATVSHQAMAGFVSSPVSVGAVGASSFDRGGDLSVIQNALESKIVQQKLADLGYTKEEISTRIDRLSNQELHDVASQVETLKAGGGAVGILVAIVLIILIIKLLGHDIQVK